MNWIYIVIGVVLVSLLIKVLKEAPAYDDVFAKRINTVISEALAGTTSVTAQQILDYIHSPEQSGLSSEIIEELSNTLTKITVTFRREQQSFIYIVEIWLITSTDEAKKITTQEVISRSELPDDVRKKFMLTEEDVLLIDWDMPFSERVSE